MMAYLKESLRKLKTSVTAVRINSVGRKVSNKYVLIESDDWGAIRMPSRNVLNTFINDGYSMQNSVYKYDGLASQKDLNRLFDGIRSIRDTNGNPPKITANFILANPDFDKIRESNFSEFFYEPFTETYNKYPEHHENMALWNHAISEKLIQPQFHGREHLNIQRWLTALRKNANNIRYFFDFKTTYSGNDDYSFMEALDWTTRDELDFHKKYLKEGLLLFEKIFGFKSKSFIAPCYVWDPELENVLVENGVEWLQSVRNQYIPTGMFARYIKKPHSFSEESNGLHYNVRNCFFEPSTLSEKNWVDACLFEMDIAFKLNKPAVISSHRVNYVGYIDQKNGEQGVKQLRTLLERAVKKWPDLQFISTDELNNIS